MKKYQIVQNVLLDGKAHQLQEIVKALEVYQGNLEWEDFYKRVRGHLSYMKKMGLVTNIDKGVWCIL